MPLRTEAGSGDPALHPPLPRIKADRVSRAYREAVVADLSMTEQSSWKLKTPPDYFRAALFRFPEPEETAVGLERRG